MTSKATFTLPFTPTLTPSQDTSSNSTDYKKFHAITASFYDAILQSVIWTNSIVCVLIIFTNILMLAVILTSSLLRSRMRNQMVVSLAAAHLIVGFITTPFTVDASVRKDWVHSCYGFVLLTIIGVYVQNFVSVWNVVAILLHYLARMKRYDGPAWLSRLPHPSIIVALPWALALLLLVPIVFGGLHGHTWSMWNDAYCPLKLQDWASYTLNIISFFLPVVVLIVLTVMIVVLYQQRDKGRDSREKAEMGVIGTETVGEMETCWVHVTLAVLSIVLLGPRHIFILFRSYIRWSWKSVIVTSILVHLLSILAPFLLALVLLLMLPDLRGRVVEVVTKLPCLSSVFHMRSPPQAAGKTSVGPVAFTDLQDE